MSEKRKMKPHSERVREMFRAVHDEWVLVSDLIPSIGCMDRTASERYNSFAESALRMEWEAKREERRAYQRLQYLKRKNWIKTKKTEKGLLVMLTDEGKMERIRRGIIDRPKLSDGRVCLVMFDIPESARRGRDAFRRFLKDTKFNLVQLSIWQTDRDVISDVLLFIKHTNIQKWVKVYVAEKKS
jgi:hypothetical protein